MEETTGNQIAHHFGFVDGEISTHDRAFSHEAAFDEEGFARLFPQVEAYPELQAHNVIADAMQQNNYLQREITAAREVYNDTVNKWNGAIFEWPTKQIVAAKRGYTTRIPFSTSKEIKEKARDVFF